MALSFAHFSVDCFPGLIHTVLPAIQDRFVISVRDGAMLLTIFLLAANGIQVLIGHMRSDKESPLFLYLGMLLAMSILLFSFVPAGSKSMPLAILVSILCASGIGMTHPEALRAVHRIEGISSAVSSSIYMGGGVIGFAFGSWASTYLFHWWGFWGQLPFCGLALVGFAAMRLTGVRLATESSLSQRKPSAQTVNIPFWPVMTIATLSAIAAQVMIWLIPQHMNMIGAELSFGGVAVGAFSLAGGLGGMVMARVAARRGEAPVAAVMLAAGTPFIAAYLGSMQYRWAPMLMFVGGFFCYGTYPILISLARHSRGPRLGQRMGLIVGGIWLSASVFPMLLGSIVEHIGTGPVMATVPVLFAASWLMAVWMALKYKHQTQIHMAVMLNI